MQPTRVPRRLRLETPLLLAVLMGGPVGSSAAAPAAPATPVAGDSSIAVSDSLIPDSCSVATLRVHLEGGRVLSASRVTPLPNGLLRVVGEDGSAVHVAIARVRRIEDDHGNDRTLEIVDSAKTLHTGSPLPPAQGGRPRRWRAFQFKPEPKSECGGFMVTETEAFRRVGGASDVTGDAWIGRLDLGAMRNTGPRTALGGTVFVGGSDNQGQLGVSARGRLWLSREIGLDVAPGLILRSNQVRGPDFRGPGVAARIGVTARDVLGLSLQVSSVRYRPYPYWPAPTSETSWGFGLVWGSQMGAAAILLSVVTSAVSAIQ